MSIPKNAATVSILCKSPHDSLTMAEPHLFIRILASPIYPLALCGGKPVSYFERFSLAIHLIERPVAPWRRILFTPSMLLRGMPLYGFVVARHGFLLRGIARTRREWGWPEISR